VMTFWLGIVTIGSTTFLTEPLAMPALGHF
jgi:hypothetical protein